jgi:hypothetical protein
VLVGDVGLNLRRSDMYVKELDFLISTSYGPGRYDPYYEEGGQDYPVGYVRWTENRNMAAYLRMIADGQVKLDALFKRTHPIDRASEAYDSLKAGSADQLLAILEYPPRAERLQRRVQIAEPRAAKPGRVRVAVVGAGKLRAGHALAEPAEAARSLRVARSHEPHRGECQRRRETLFRGVCDDGYRAGARGSRDRSGRDRHAA